MSIWKSTSKPLCSGNTKNILNIKIADNLTKNEKEPNSVLSHFFMQHRINCSKNEVAGMPINKTVRRFCSPEHVCVLTLTTLIPDTLTEEQMAFYTPLCEEFEKVVNERLFPLALDEFHLCEDRRKRWRYTPQQAKICLCRKDENTLLFRLSSPFGVDIEEEHTWRDDTIIRRVKRK